MDSLYTIDEVIELVENGDTYNLQVTEEVETLQIFDNLVYKEISGGGRLEKEFDFEDIIAGKILIGNIPVTKRVFSVVLIITTAFNSGVLITIGDDAAEGRLMTVAQNTPQAVNYYQNEPEVKYISTTALKLYFTGAVTQGEGIAIIYYS